MDDLLRQLNLENGAKTGEVLDSVSLKSNRDDEFESKYSGLPLGKLSIERYDCLINKL